MNRPLDSLIVALGTGVIVTDDDRIAGHVADWTGRWVGHTPAVVFPRTLSDVETTLDWCRQHRHGVVPQGGNTGMVGGSVPLDGELVLNLTRLSAIETDELGGTLVAGAGATLADVQLAAKAAGWLYGVDLGARDTATIGGTVATNAGGLQVIRHGDTRCQLLGIEAVTGRGEVVGDLRGLLKDNTGYHLPSLLCGSEGTLGVITRVCLRLLPRAEEEAVALLGFESERDAIDVIRALRVGVHDLQALELFFAEGLDLVRDVFDLPVPLPDRHGAYLLVEAGGSEGTVERFATDLARAGVDLNAAAVATDTAQRARLWRYREAHTEAIAHVGVPHKLDITVPLASMERFISTVRDVVRTAHPAADVWLFGHAGDGNLHVNITGVAAADAALDETVLGLVAELGGSISAEHGVGRAKASLLHLNRSPDEIATARRIKDAFDPDGILNPGVLFV